MRAIHSSLATKIAVEKEGEAFEKVRLKGLDDLNLETRKSKKLISKSFGSGSLFKASPTSYKSTPNLYEP